jgi:hypothetical protein
LLVQWSTPWRYAARQQIKMTGSLFIFSETNSECCVIKNGTLLIFYGPLNRTVISILCCWGATAFMDTTGKSKSNNTRGGGGKGVKILTCLPPKLWISGWDWTRKCGSGVPLLFWFNHFRGRKHIFWIFLKESRGIRMMSSDQVIKYSPYEFKLKFCPDNYLDSEEHSLALFLLIFM